MPALGPCTMGFPELGRVASTVEGAVQAPDGEAVPEHVWVDTMHLLAFLVLAFALL